MLLVGVGRVVFWGRGEGLEGGGFGFWLDWVGLWFLGLFVWLVVWGLWVGFLVGWWEVGVCGYVFCRWLWGVFVWVVVGVWGVGLVMEVGGVGCGVCLGFCGVVGWGWWFWLGRVVVCFVGFLCLVGFCVGWCVSFFFVVVGLVCFFGLFFGYEVRWFLLFLCLGCFWFFWVRGLLGCGVMLLVWVVGFVVFVWLFWGDCVSVCFVWIFICEFVLLVVFFGWVCLVVFGCEGFWVFFVSGWFFFGVLVGDGGGLLVFVCGLGCWWWWFLVV